MSTGICKSPDSRYWRALYKAAVSEIGNSKLPERIAEAREGGCAKGAGIVSGCRRQRRRERGSRGRDACFAQLSDAVSAAPKSRRFRAVN